MMLSDVWRLSFACIGPKSRTERPRKTKIGTEVAHVTRDSDTTFEVKRSKVKVTRPLWLVVLAGQRGHTVMVNLSICVHDVYRVTTCRPGRGHIVAAARLQLVCRHVESFRPSSHNYDSIRIRFRFDAVRSSIRRDSTAIRWSSNGRWTWFPSRCHSSSSSIFV